MTIKFYKSNAPFGFLNNFKRARMFVYGRWWNNVEAPYQSQKTLDTLEQHAIWSAKTPREARDLGQKVTMRPNWDKVKVDVMYECVMAKFLQHADLRRDLMKTGIEILVEDSPVDSFWGCGKDGTGQNMLGQVLMRVRKELQGE
jgi:ribA/ribD-fused uncharacterized protein